MNKIMILSLTMLCLSNSFMAAEASPLALAAEKVQQGYNQGKYELKGYPHSLLIEGMIRYNMATGNEEGLAKAMKHAELYETKMTSKNKLPLRTFEFLPYWIYKVKGTMELKKRILAENRNYYSTILFSPEGAMMRYSKKWNSTAMLVDSMQNYNFRLAMTGQLTNDPEYSAKAVKQFEVYRQVLRNSETGLWHQGRGWLKDTTQLSPGNWSRGHGWISRGMINTLQILPPDSNETQKLKSILEELSQSLIKVQLDSGMWPCLLDRDPADSPPETSGTALIAGHMAIAVAHGWLPAKPYAEVSQKAFTALPSLVNDDGTVRSVSPGPGPVWEDEPWAVKSFPNGDKHGPFAIMFAALGEHYLNQWHIKNNKM